MSEFGFANRGAFSLELGTTFSRGGSGPHLGEDPELPAEESSRGRDVGQRAVTTKLSDPVSDGVAGPSGGVDACIDEGVDDDADVVMAGVGHVVTLAIHASAAGQDRCEAVG